MRTSNLLVSALCVTANRPAFLERALAWWEAQTWPRKEIVVVDGSRKKLRLDLSKAREVRHVVLEPDLDMGAKHDRAIAEAQGEVLCYFDDDDYWAPRRVLRQLEPIAMDRATVSGIPRDAIVYVPGARFARMKFNLPKDWVGNGNEGWVGNGWTREGTLFSFHDGSAMFSRAALAKAIPHPPIPVGQKVIFLNHLHRAGERFATVRNDKLFCYVRHGSNTWRYKEASVESIATPSWIPSDVLDFWRKGVA